MVKRILFTAPEAYQPRLCTVMAETHHCGIRPAFVPFISTFLHTKHASFKEFCSQVASYDYIICSSVMAVRALQFSGLPSSVLEGKVIAIGNDQKAVKQKLGFEPVFQDAEPSMMGIVEALMRQSELSAKRIAVLMPEFIGLPVPPTITNFLSALNHTGAHVAHVFCYCTTAMGQEHYAETIEYVRKKGIDAIAITSGGEAYVLSKIQAYAAAQGCPMNLPVYSYGPYTTRCAQEVSLPIAGTSPKYQSFKDFIDYLVTK